MLKFFKLFLSKNVDERILKLLLNNSAKIYRSLSQYLQSKNLANCTFHFLTYENLACGFCDLMILN
jgi:hypothetical protein